jgi:hypothetical protein
MPEGYDARRTVADAERDELRQPRVPELHHVRHRVADVGGEELLVRRAPRDLLHADMDAGSAALERRHELRDHLTLASHRPELDDGLGVAATRAAGADRAGAADHGRCQRRPPPPSARPRSPRPLDHRSCLYH